MRHYGFGVLLAGLALALPATAEAQVVREEGVVSIAGVLGGTDDVNEYTFDGEAGQVLFASIDSYIYQSQGRGGDSGGCEEGAVGADACPGEGDDGGGCSGEDEGSPLHVKLEVVDAAGVPVCWAGRPAQPGWQRDPRLVCRLTSAQAYTLRVLLAGMGEEPGEVELPATQAYPYLLNVSLREIAGSRDLKAAVKASRNLIP